MKFQAFVSSTAEDLQPERDRLSHLHFPTAQLQIGIRTSGQDRLDRENTQLLVGLLGATVDPAVEEACEQAGRLGIERHMLIRSRPFGAPSPLGTLIADLRRAGVTCEYFSGLDDLQRKFTMLIEKKLLRLAISKPAHLNSLLIHDTGHIPERPPLLVGRGGLFEQINARLDQGERVLLHGVGGIGKTALAATVAARRLDALKNRNVLWATVGQGAGLRETLNSLGAAFGPEQASKLAAQEEDEEALHFVRQLIEQVQPLVVLDDCWDSETLGVLLEGALPAGVPVLITSRAVLPFKPAFDVTRLDRVASIQLLGYHADADLNQDADANRLCDRLTDHPYALEIAGTWMCADGILAADVNSRLETPPGDLAVPPLLVAEGQAHIGLLIGASAMGLDSATRKAFWLLGNAPTPRITAEILGALLPQPQKLRPPQGAPKVLTQEEQMQAIGEALVSYFKRSAELTELGYTAPIRVPNEKVDPEIVRTAERYLQSLARRSLVHYVRAERDCGAYYTMHDLTFACVREHQAGAYDTAAKAYADYAAWHAVNIAKPSAKTHHNALNAELPNLLSMAQWAAQAGQGEIVRRLAHALFFDSGFLSARGYFREALTLVQAALESSLPLEKCDDELTFWGYLVVVYRNLARYDDAIDACNKALGLARLAGNYQRESELVAEMGNIYTQQGRCAEALESINEAKNLAERAAAQPGIRIQTSSQPPQPSSQSDIAQANILQRQGKYREAADIYNKVIERARQFNDPDLLCIALTNLGAAHMYLRQNPEAIRCHEEALTIANRIGDRAAVGRNTGNLGLVYANMGQPEKAVEQYQKALTIAREIGDRDTESLWLGNLGSAVRA